MWNLPGLGIEPIPLLWQVGSYPLNHQGSPRFFKIVLKVKNRIAVWVQNDFKWYLLFLFLCGRIPSITREYVTQCITSSGRDQNFKFKVQFLLNVFHFHITIMSKDPVWKVCESEVKVAQSCPTLCDPMDCPWNFSGQNTGVGSLSLQGIFPTQGSNPGLPRCRWFLYQLSFKGSPWKVCITTTTTTKSFQSCPTLCDSIDGSPPGSPVPGILQARTLEWVAISFSNAWKWKWKENCSAVSDSISWEKRWKWAPWWQLR